MGLIYGEWVCFNLSMALVIIVSKLVSSAYILFCAGMAEWDLTGN